ncbi:hypothetical protein HF520_00130 [Romboutsia sp. CE17]|uniref:hypothetical protein n=1 Tax=Romboutsia sp. CE17 TaxID=2724150 RepID=UPI001442DF49|nr:hypothetical protein [Romboutsia sp. CE17]QJA07453.1 hypothetical protein HF520_00130 [Romboutsia sp. CE17]
MDMMMALCLVLLALTLGDVISAMTKAFVPSVFVSAIIFVIGFWTIFPADIVDLSGIGNPLAQLAILLLITHMGTLMSLKELASQWRTIIISLAGIVGICVGAVALGTVVFDWETAIIATPPLTGGLVASIMMADAATAKGLNDLAVLAILVYVAQGFAGYPLTSILLRKEGNKLLSDFRSGKIKSSAKSEVEETIKEESKLRIIPKLPEKYDTTYMVLLRVAIVALVAVKLEGLTGGTISKYVIALVLGAIASEMGLIDRKPLVKSGSFGILITSLMAFVMAGLAKATPDTLAEMAMPLIGIIVFGVVGMGIFSIIAGKLLGISKEMSFAVALTALYGFPPNYIITEDVSKALAETPEEKEFLMDQMLPQMLVGGFTTVTIASVIIAGLFINLI